MLTFPPQDGDQSELLIVLCQFTKAFGGMPKIAEAAQINRTQLYRTLSEQGNPELRSLSAILGTMGLRLAVQPVKTKKAKVVVPRQHNHVRAVA